MAQPEFNYIGYGPNNDPDMIEAICGPESIIKLGEEVCMFDTQLCVVSIDQIPDEPVRPNLPSARKIISMAWGEESGFETYAARCRDGQRTRGTAMQLRDTALNAIWNWELTELGWFNVGTVRATTASGQIIPAKTELIPSTGPIARIVDGINHPNFLMPKELMIANAIRAREA